MSSPTYLAMKDRVDIVKALAALNGAILQLLQHMPEGPEKAAATLQSQTAHEAMSAVLARLETDTNVPSPEDANG